MRIEKEGVVTQPITQLIHLFENRILDIMPCKKGHSSQSYALLMSSFNASEPFFAFFNRIHGVQSLVSHQNIINDEMPWDKGTLSRRDNRWEDLFQPVSQHLRNNLINSIAQANGMEIRHFLRVLHFRD